MKHRRALVLSLTYALLAGAWILLSDAALFLLLSGQGLPGVIGTSKGLVFVLVTAVVLYVLLRGMDRRETTRHASLIANHPAPMLVIDPSDGRIVDANKAAIDFYGWRPEHVGTMRFEDIDIADGACTWVPGVDDRGSVSRGVVSRHRTAFGALRNVEVYAGPSSVGDRELALAIVQDVTERQRAEQALRDSEERLSLVLRGSDEGWWDWDLKADRIHLSPRWWSMLGYEPGELPADAGLWRRLAHPDDLHAVDEVLTAAIASGAELGEAEFRLRHRDGRYVPVLARAFVSRDADGQAVRLSGTNRDLTDRMKVAEERRLAQMVFASTGEGITVTDVAGRILEVNPAFERITGFSRAEIVGKNPRVLQSGRHDKAFYRGMWETLKSTGQWRGEIWNRRSNGEVYPEWLTVSAVRNVAGRTTHYVGVFSDITTVKEAQEQLEFLAHHDALTRLPNRTLLRERLTHGITRARRHSQQLAVLLLDLDRFKNVNDTLGHPVGDDLLIEVANRIGSRIRADDTLARLGGDEFALLLEDETGPAAVEAVARKLTGAFALPVQVADHALTVTASIGISLYPADGEDADTLLKNADSAMYKAKQQGRNGFRFFAPELTRGALERLVMETALRKAVSHDQLVLHYQPQVALDSGALVGVEALVRWEHPDFGLMQPGDFIPLAEEIGVIDEIGMWVLHEACRQMALWRDGGVAVPRVAVNLSVKQIDGDRLVSAVADALASAGLTAGQLELEVTESMIMEQPDEARKALAGLRGLGVQIAIDDFGTGYSSLAYLKLLQIDRLKIDRSFVKEIGRDPNDEAITRAVIALADSLGLETVAEGIEEVGQIAFLRREGCDVGQGFYFSRPVPAEALSRLIFGGGLDRR